MTTVETDKKISMAELRRERNSNIIFAHYTLPVSYDLAVRLWPEVNFSKFLCRKLTSVSKTTIDGHICVVIERPEKNSKSNIFRAAVAFGVPYDAENRRKARNIASGRLFCERENGNSFEVQLNLDSKNLDDVFNQALRIAADLNQKVFRKGREVPYAPLWVRLALEEGAEFKRVLSQRKPKKDKRSLQTAAE